MAMIEVSVEGIGIDGHNNPLILLCNSAHTRFIPIPIGAAEALAIQMGMDERMIDRPMTSDLISNVMQMLNMQLVQVTINDFVNAVFYARLHVRIGADSSIQELDTRPSDGLALALRVKCPILIDEIVSEKVGIPIENSQAPDTPEMERFKRLIEDVNWGETDDN